jgi:sporulation protein YlmC with PRC-barrel domain
LKLSALLGSPVKTTAGKRLGRVWDVRARFDGDHLVLTGLVVGRVGLLERLGFGAAGSSERLRTTDAIPWSDVVEAKDGRVIVRAARG